MPLYEYHCDACGRRFELIRKFSDQPLKECPHCGRKGTVHKLMSSPAIQFKGSGWYITDYAKKDQTAAATKSGEATSGEKQKGAGDKTEKADKAETGATATDSAAKPSTPSAGAEKKD